MQATARWVTLATALGLMDVGAGGWVETLRIRLVHAMVRHHLHASDEWDDAVWACRSTRRTPQLTITAGFLALPLRIAKGLRHPLLARRPRGDHPPLALGRLGDGRGGPTAPTSYDDAGRTWRISQEFALRPPMTPRPWSALFSTTVSVPTQAARTAQRCRADGFCAPSCARCSPRCPPAGRPDIASVGLRPPPHHVVDLARPVVRSGAGPRHGAPRTERDVARRELRLVTWRLGIDLADLKTVRARYRAADENRMETVA